jgi:hypothetical protein
MWCHGAVGRGSNEAVRRCQAVSVRSVVVVAATAGILVGFSAQQAYAVPFPWEQSSCSTLPSPTRTGTANADSMSGSSGSGWIDSREGNDRVTITGGQFCVDAGPGNDIVDVAQGQTEIHGGPGDDIISIAQGDAIVTGGPGRDQITGNQGRYYIETAGDGEVDKVACGGSPNDEAVLGPEDVLLNSSCETVRRTNEAPTVDDLAAEWYATQYGVSMGVARAWMTVQDKAEGVNEEVAAGAAGPEYAGVWFDNGQRRFKVALTSTAHASSVSSVLASHGISADSDIVTVTHTQRQLEDAQPAIEDQLADLPLGTVEIARNTETNSVQVTVAAAATPEQRAHIASVAASAPVRVNVVDSPDASLLTEALDCKLPDCARPLRGGVRIATNPSRPDKDGNNHTCTAGFVARSRSDQAPYVLTAGHCFDNFTDDSSEWGAVNPFALVDPFQLIGFNRNPYVFGDSGDAGLIGVRATSYWAGTALEPWILVTTSSSGSTRRDEEYTIRAVRFNQRNRIVCMTGERTRSRCGQVTDLNVEAGSGLGGTNVKHLGKILSCGVDRGDSGGPVFKLGVAYGILTHKRGCNVYFQGAVTAQDLLNVNILTR